MSLASQTEREIIFSDPESDYMSRFCFSVTYLVYIVFFLYVVIIHLIWRGKGVGIYFKLILYWIELTRV